METMHELIPFAKEMLSQKPNRKMVKLYMLGSVLAFFGVVIGLVETVCSPFSSEGRTEEEEERSQPAAAREQRAPQTRGALLPDKDKDKGKARPALQRALVTRHHAS
ncbi:G0S2 protein, partial [Daphoenositta chrysoptera]|nr:G0S2 protein [Daphoenositta chrysoptera]